MASLKVCTTPRCPTLSTGGKCPTCKTSAEQARGSAAQRGYGAAWQRTRSTYLRDHPHCECDACATLPPHRRPAATDVDHIDGLGPQGPRGNDPDNLRALAHACHSRRTARDQPGGWNAR